MRRTYTHTRACLNNELIFDLELIFDQAYRIAGRRTGLGGRCDSDLNQFSVKSIDILVRIGYHRIKLQQQQQPVDELYFKTAKLCVCALWHAFVTGQFICIPDARQPTRTHPINVSHSTVKCWSGRRRRRRRSGVRRI